MWSKQLYKNAIIFIVYIQLTHIEIILGHWDLLLYFMSHKAQWDSLNLSVLVYTGLMVYKAPEGPEVMCLFWNYLPQPKTVAHSGHTVRPVELGMHASINSEMFGNHGAIPAR